MFEHKFTMNLALRDFLKSNKPLLESLPEYLLYEGELGSNIEEIISTKELQIRNTAGLSKNKEILRNKLVKETLDVSEVIEAYARLTGNVVLGNKVHFTETHLKRAPGSMLCDSAMVVYANATEHATSLEKYGVTASMLTSLNGSIGAYKAVLPVTHSSKASSKQITTKLKELFKANDDILEKLDSLMVMVKKAHPDFYKGYTNIRKLPATATSKLTLRATVTCASSGGGLKGVRATFTPKVETLTAMEEPFTAMEETTVKPIVKKTGEKGMFRIKNMPDGVYSVTIEKIGYAPKTVMVNVTGSELAKLNVKLEKN